MKYACLWQLEEWVIKIQQMLLTSSVVLSVLFLQVSSCKLKRLRAAHLGDIKLHWIHQHTVVIYDLPSWTQSTTVSQKRCPVINNLVLYTSRQVARMGRIIMPWLGWYTWLGGLCWFEWATNSADWMNNFAASHWHSYVHHLSGSFCTFILLC